MGDSQPSKQTKANDRGHRVAVTEEVPFTGTSPDYADAFEVARAPTDHRSAERWARDGFERLPVEARRSALLIHRWIFGFRLGPWASPDHVFGWKIAASEPDFLHLEARSRLLSGDMVWRLHETRLVMTTFLRYEMQRTGPMVWGVLGNIHRGGAPHLLALAASARPAQEPGQTLP